MSDHHNELIEIRRNKLAVLRAQGNAYPNDFKVNTDIKEINEKYASLNQAALDAENEILLSKKFGWENNLRNPSASLQVAGRIKLHRVMGKTTFAHICDSGGAIQLYLKRFV